MSEMNVKSPIVIAYTATCLCVTPFQAPSTEPASPLPCVRPLPAEGPYAKSRILQSFPPDPALPTFLGAFGDTSETYRLHLWHDRAGVFGEFLHPVLDVDSPTAQLSSVAFDETSGRLMFQVPFPPQPWAFDGTLAGPVLQGRLRRNGQIESLTLTALPPDLLSEALKDAYQSRAQFDCAMILFVRFRPAG